MKTLLLIISLTLFPVVTHPECACISTQCKLIKSINEIETKLRKHASPKAVPAKVLAPVIIKLSRTYNVDPLLVVRIILIESRGIEKAYNKHSNDYGIAQIHLRGKNKTKANIACAMRWQCGLEMGIKIMATTKRGCNYNQGPRVRNIILCEKYERKLASIN